MARKRKVVPPVPEEQEADDIRNQARSRASTPFSAASSHDLQIMARERGLNLRQLFLRAHRGMNRRIARGLVAHGYGSIKPAHITVYANIDLNGTRISDLAERANMTVQGMGQLVSDLEALGFLLRVRDPVDSRAKIVTFTNSGWRLMVTSFQVLREIEAEFEATIGPRELKRLRSVLSRMFDD